MGDLGWTGWWKKKVPIGGGSSNSVQGGGCETVRPVALQRTWKYGVRQRFLECERFQILHRCSVIRNPTRRRANPKQNQGKVKELSLSSPLVCAFRPLGFPATWPTSTTATLLTATVPLLAMTLEGWQERTCASPCDISNWRKGTCAT